MYVKPYHKCFVCCSYDTWFHNLVLDQDMDSPLPVVEKHRVDARWLTKLGEFNEWMNEEDFALPLSGVSTFISYTSA